MVNAHELDDLIFRADDLPVDEMERREHRVFNRFWGEGLSY